MIGFKPKEIYVSLCCFFLYALKTLYILVVLYYGANLAREMLRKT